MTKNSLLCLTVAFGAWFLSACSGYDVEDLGNSADVLLASFEHGDRATFSELLGVDCERVGLVGSYTPSDRVREQVGDANIDLQNDFFTLVVGFDSDGDVLRAVRVARVPVDLDWVAPYSGPCDATLVSEHGRGAIHS